MLNEAAVAPTSADRSPSLFTPAFVALTLASLAYFTAAGMLIPALPRHVTSVLGGGDVAVGVVVGTFSVSAVLLRPVAGVYGDRRGRRPLMFAGAFVAAASILAYGLVATPTALAMLRLVTGAGEALFFVGMLTTFSDLAPPERRGEAMSLASLSLYLGIGIGPVVAEVVADRVGFTPVWVASSALTLLAAVLVTRVPETRVPETRVPETLTHAGDQATPGARPRLVHPAGILPGVVLLASILGMAGFLAFVPLHALDLGMGGAGWVLALFAGVVVLVRSLGARLPDVLGPARAIRAALSLSLVGLALVGLWRSPSGLLVGAVVLAAGVALLTPSVFAVAAAAVPASERGQVMATTSAFIDIAFGAGPFTLGFVAAAAGRSAVFVAGAAAAAAGLVLVAIRPPWASAAAEPGSHRRHGRRPARSA